MICCQYEKMEMLPLPFERSLYLDFYDGPLAGYALCSVCHQCFYFKVLRWESSIFCRVFGFAPIEMDYDRVEDDMRQWTEKTKLVLDERRKIGNDDLPLPESTEYAKQIEAAALCLKFTHLCITESYLDRGYWWKMEEADKELEEHDDWYEHLGVVYDFRSLTFHLKR